MDSKRVLLVDDEIAPGAIPGEGNYMWYYAEALREAGFDVVEAVGPDAALETLDRTPDPFCIIILDIMMPPGKAFAETDTQQGLRTGLLLLDKITVLCPQVPVLVLTNVNNAKTVGELRGRPDVKAVLFKPDYTPYMLVDEVRRVLESVK